MAKNQLPTNLNDVLTTVGLMVEPDGELRKFQNNIHNVGMTPMLALGRYIMRMFANESVTHTSHH